MDKEIKTLKQKIIELNTIIEELKNKSKTIEITELIKEKNNNEKFSELYQSFTKKTTCPYEIDMLIGTHLSKQEKNYQKKFNNLIEVQNRLKKRIADLTKELNMFKYEKKLPSDLEEHKIEFELDNNTYGGKFDCKTTKVTEIKREYKCNTFQKYINSEKKMNTVSNIVDTGKINKKLGENKITINTQISYKRRKKEGNNQ